MPDRKLLLISFYQWFMCFPFESLPLTVLEEYVRKVRQYVVNREWGNIRAGRRRNHFPFHVWLAQNWIGQRDYLAADVCKKIAHSPQKLLIEKIAHKICSQWANLLWAKICSINLLTENQICSRRINFAHGELWTALQSTCNLSMYAWHNFYLHTNCSKRRKFAHSKEKLLTKIKFAPSKNLLKFAHRICLQHRKNAHDEKPCRLGWINTMAKCFVSSQSEHGWRAPLNGLSRNGWNVLGRTFQYEILVSQTHRCIYVYVMWIHDNMIRRTEDTGYGAYSEFV